MMLICKARTEDLEYISFIILFIVLFITFLMSIKIFEILIIAALLKHKQRNLIKGQSKI